MIVLKKKDLFALRDMLNQYLDKHFDEERNWYPKERSLYNDYGEKKGNAESRHEKTDT